MVRSAWTWAPTAALATLLVAGAITLAAFPVIEERRMLGTLNDQIAQFEPRSNESRLAERSRSGAQARVDQLRQFRERTRKDLDALREVTKLVAPPGWAAQFDLTRRIVQVAGESNQAADLLKAFDGSALFKNAEFTTPLSRSKDGGDNFRLRAEREETAR